MINAETSTLKDYRLKTGIEFVVGCVYSRMRQQTDLVSPFGGVARGHQGSRLAHYLSVNLT